MAKIPSQREKPALRQIRAAGHTKADETAATAITTNSSGNPTEPFIGSCIYINAGTVETELKVSRTLRGCVVEACGPGARPTFLSPRLFVGVSGTTFASGWLMAA